MAKGAQIAADELARPGELQQQRGPEFTLFPISQTEGLSAPPCLDWAAQRRADRRNRSPSVHPTRRLRAGLPFADGVGFAFGDFFPGLKEDGFFSLSLESIFSLASCQRFRCASATRLLTAAVSSLRSKAAGLAPAAGALRGALFAAERAGVFFFG